MKLETRYATHPQDSMLYTTEEIRSHYLIEEVFVKDEANFVYSHNDRIIAGGILPVDSKVELGSTKELGTKFFFERREAGVINVGGPGKVLLDGKVFTMENSDGLYIGMGTEEVVFESVDATYVPEQCNDEKLKKVLKVNDFRHFFLDFIIVTYYN